MFVDVQCEDSLALPILVTRDNRHTRPTVEVNARRLFSGSLFLTRRLMGMPFVDVSVPDVSGARGAKPIGK